VICSKVGPCNIHVDFVKIFVEFSFFYNGLKVNVFYMANPTWRIPDTQVYVLSLKARDMKVRPETSQKCGMQFLEHMVNL
jgi:hypothetical protein